MVCPQRHRSGSFGRDGLEFFRFRNVWRAPRLPGPCALGIDSRGMRIEFSKMNGAGNDFIVVDNRDRSIALSRGQVAKLCDRRFGVGADGLILLEPAKTSESDWSWAFYNSDGSDAEMCGNGARCFAGFIDRVVGALKTPTRFDTLAGRIGAEKRGAGFRVNLTDPFDLRPHIDLELDGQPREVGYVNTGVPHVVVYVSDVDQAKVDAEGGGLRFHERFQPEGANVNFAEILGEGRLRSRTYERGVEGETLACGTGVAAVALVTAAREGWESPVSVRVRSGDELLVEFDRQEGGFRNIFLSGPAEFVFEGAIEI